MLDVEYALEDPVVETGLAQLVAVQDGPRPLPPLLEEVEQRFVGLLGAQAVEPVQDPGGAVDAETALARAHGEAEQAADVVEVGGGTALDCLLELPPRDELALADQLIVGEALLLALEPLAERVRGVVL